MYRRTLPVLLPGLLPMLLLQACGSDAGEAGEPDRLRLSRTTVNEANGSTLIIDISYTAEGNLASQLARRDGSEVLDISYDTDETGRLTRRADDTDQDGVADRFQAYEYIDGLGRSRAYDLEEDGTVVGVSIYSFEQGLATSLDIRDIDDAPTVESAEVSSGTLSSRQLFGYENGRLVSISEDIDGNGSTDSLETATYNADGTLATSVVNSLAGGTVTASTFEYETGPCRSAAFNSTDAYFCVTP